LRACKNLAGYRLSEQSRKRKRHGRILGVRLPPQEDGDNEPWTAPPSKRRQAPPITGELPKTMELVLGNQIYIAKAGLHPGLRNRFASGLAAFQNPEFYKAQAMRLSTYNTPRIVGLRRGSSSNTSALPRGCSGGRSIASSVTWGIRATIRDERCQGQPLAVTFPRAAAIRAESGHQMPCSRTTPAYWRLRPHSAKPSLAHG